MSPSNCECINDAVSFVTGSENDDIGGACSGEGTPATTTAAAAATAAATTAVVAAAAPAPGATRLANAESLGGAPVQSGRNENSSGRPPSKIAARIPVGQEGRWETEAKGEERNGEEGEEEGEEEGVRKRETGGRDEGRGREGGAKVLIVAERLRQEMEQVMMMMMGESARVLHGACTGVLCAFILGASPCSWLRGSMKLNPIFFSHGFWSRRW